MIKRILVVDDEPDIVKVVVFRLRKAGYDITHAPNGLAALDILQRGDRFDLILLDLIMPLMDGYEFCKLVKSDKALSSIPIIVLSASATRDIKIKSQELGASDYVIKPFEPDVLIKKVKAIIG